MEHPPAPFAFSPRRRQSPGFYTEWRAPLARPIPRGRRYLYIRHFPDTGAIHAETRTGYIVRCRTMAEAVTVLSPDL